MKLFTTLVVVLLVLASGLSSAQAAVIFCDDFEGYADQAAMNAVWVPSVGPGASLSTDQSVSPTHSAFIPGNTTAYRSTRGFGNVGPATDANPLVWSFQYYDANAGVAIARNYMQLWDNSAGLEQLVSLGVYNAVPGESVANHHTYYAARVAFQTGAPGWILLKDPGVATRSIGWHELKAVFGTSTVDFYVDGTLGASAKIYSDGSPAITFDTMQLGSGLSSAGGAAYYDDVCLAIIPEPATMALAGLGLMGLVLTARRRSA
jgi:hypothetical protein